MREIKDYDIDAAKFWSWVNRDGDGCWEWRGGLNTGGYGLFSLNSPEWMYEKTGRTKTQLLAHRVAYYLENGGLETYRHVCHKCDNPKCCNPKHMFDGSIFDNVQDMIMKGRGFWQRGKVA